VNRLFNVPESAAAKYSNANAALPLLVDRFLCRRHAGGGVLFDAVGPPGPANVPVDRHGIGALAGGQVGANYQVDRFVLGVEAEGFWSDLHNRINLFSPGAGLANAGIWHSERSQRVGLRYWPRCYSALPSIALWVYGKAGWVWGRFDWNYNNAAQSFNPAGRWSIPRTAAATSTAC